MKSTSSAATTDTDPAPTPPPAQTPPTYHEWLAAHEDSALIQLLSRTARAELRSCPRATPSLCAAQTTAEQPGAPNHSFSGEALLSGLAGVAGGASTVASGKIPALHHLSAIELLCLHAAAELDAAHHWISRAELRDTITELLDIAGAAPQRRPNATHVDAALHSLAAWGLIYGPYWALPNESTPSPSPAPDPVSDRAPVPSDTQLRIPAHITENFQPSTPDLWRLADSNKCPIPISELPSQIAELPSPQRRMLTTLNHAGGVGHSATLGPDADPALPLPTLVRSGILDQLDENTARLSGRVGQVLRGTLPGVPGGDFLPPAAPQSTPTAGSTPTASSTPTAGNSTDSGCIAAAVQTIHDLADFLRDLGSHPMIPLLAGGVGSREINKMARRRGLPTTTINDLITRAWETELINQAIVHTHTTTEPRWSVTHRGAKFLDVPLAMQWAMLLLAWVRSPYAPWLAQETGARALQKPLDSIPVAALRRAWPTLFRSLSPFSSDATLPHNTPPSPQHSAQQQLWRASPWLAWSTREDSWSAVWEEAHALGLLTAGTPGAAMKVLDEVLRSDLPEEDRLSQLAEGLAALLPAPVDTLIVQADHTILAPGLLSAPAEAQLRRLAELESAGMASVWRVTKQSVQHAFAAGDQAQQLLDFLGSMAPGGLEALPQSLRYLVQDTARTWGEDIPAVEPKENDLCCVPDVLASPCSPPEIAAAAAAAVESFRRHVRGQADPTDGEYAASTSVHSGSTTEMMAHLRRAYDAGSPVRVAYAGAEGQISRQWVSIILMNSSGITAVAEDDGQTLRIHPHRLVAVEITA